MKRYSDMNVIIDTNICISTIIFDQSVEQYFKEIINIPNLKIYFSTETYQELEAKLFTSSKIQKLIAKSNRPIDNQHIIQYLEILKVDLGIIVETKLPKIDICRDPQANKFLELAREIGADYIISGDKDLLELQEFEGCQIVKPGDFVEALAMNL